MMDLRALLFVEIFMKCPKCDKEMEQFVSIDTIECHECLSCKIVMAMCYNPTIDVSKAFTRLVSECKKVFKKVLDSK